MTRRQNFTALVRAELTASQNAREARIENPFMTDDDPANAAYIKAVDDLTNHPRYTFGRYEATVCRIMEQGTNK